MLGTLHKCGKTAAMSAASHVGDSPLFLLDYLLRFLRVMVLLSLWRMILGDDGEASGLTLGAVLTYTLIAEVFADQLACRTQLGVALWDGSIVMRYLQPIGVVAHFGSEMVGRWAFGFCAFSLPLLLVSPLLGVSPLPASASAGALFAASLILGASVGLALEFLFGAALVALDQSIWIVENIRAAISTLLSGALLPLALMPWGLGEVLHWLPFASVASAPLRIYTGTGDPLWLLAVQLGWSAILWPATLLLWQVNREKLVGYGG